VGEGGSQDVAIKGCILILLDRGVVRSLLTKPALLFMCTPLCSLWPQLELLAHRP